MNEKPTLLCLTGFLGSGKTTVRNMFANYGNVEICNDIDKLQTLKTSKKIIVLDSLQTIEQ